MDSCTTRQFVAHMLHLLGMNRKAELTLTTATEEDIDIYIDVIKAMAKSHQDVAEFLNFSGL